MKSGDRVRFSSEDNMMWRLHRRTIRPTGTVLAARGGYLEVAMDSQAAGNSHPFIIQMPAEAFERAEPPPQQRQDDKRKAR